MKISILTVFPELYQPFIQTSLIGRAEQKGIVSSDIINFFDFSEPKERIDAPSFGPGAGMLIKPEIVQKAIESQESKHGKAFKVFFSPQGKKLTQKVVKDLYNKISDKHLLLVASRYEGMDSRVEQYYADEVISVGDFVLMGGDIPAMCFIEALLRLVPGVVGKVESVEKESFSGAFLDYPEFTAPVVWNGMQVPEIIRSGNHALIDKWRHQQAIINTIKQHFEWLRSCPLTKTEIKQVKELLPPHYVALMHGDVLLKDNQVGTTSVTSIDIHDIARSCATYDIKNYFVYTPLEDQQKIVKTLLDFWQVGYGLQYNSHRALAVSTIKLSGHLDAVIDEIIKKENKVPLLIATSAKKEEQYKEKYITYYDHSKVWRLDRPVLLLFGTGHGIAKHILDKCDFILDPVYGFSEFNHLSVRSAAAIVLDRWLGIKINR